MSNSIDPIISMIDYFIGGDKMFRCCLKQLLRGGGVYWPIIYWYVYIFHTELNGLNFFLILGIALTLLSLFYVTAWEWLFRKTVIADRKWIQNRYEELENLLKVIGNFYNHYLIPLNIDQNEKVKQMDCLNNALDRLKLGLRSEVKSESEI